VTPGNSLRQGPSRVAEHLPNDTCQTDPDLAAVVAAWPELPEPIKAGILAMVKAARQTGKTMRGQTVTGLPERRLEIRLRGLQAIMVRRRFLPP